MAVAGRTGLAHYALFTRKWKLFGNETQVRPFTNCSQNNTVFKSGHIYGTEPFINAEYQIYIYIICENFMFK